MSPTTFTLFARVILITALLWPLGGQATPLHIPDFPLFLTSAGVSPNLVITLDDSGSMRRGWVPESVASDQAIIDGPRFKSSSVNGLYYNPKITYSIPIRSDGTAYTTSFTNAYFNGFDTSKGSANLSTSYKVVGQSEPSHSYSDCPCYNTNSCSTFLTTANSSGTCRLVKHPDGTITTPTGAYYYLYYQDKPGQSKPASCPTTPSRTNDNCYVKITVSATSGADRNGDGTISSSEQDERQNFANWFSFYRTRAMAVMSGAMSSVSSLDNGKVRLGWQTINQCTTFGTTCQGYDGTNRENRIRTLSSSYRTNFYNWLQRFDVSGNTPLRGALKRAGEYFTTSGQNSPYAQDPYVTLGTEYSCRKNFNIIFTDGLWNSIDTIDSGYTLPGSNSNPDSSGTTTLGASTALSDGTVINSYSPRAPYKDVNVLYSYTNSNSLSDTAFYYWAKDLRGDLDNNVSTNMVDFSGNETEQFWNPKNDPATWQHMVNYTIGLGLSASLVANCYYRTGTGTNLVKDPNNPTPGCPAWGGSMYAGDYNNLVKGTRNWPQIDTSPTINEEPDGHVYELWHAAINSRGKFYSADDPAQLVQAFQDVMDTISSVAAAGGGSRVSSNVARITEANPTAFVARFNADWSGTLQAFPVNVDGTLGTTAYWAAGSLIPPGNLPSSAPPFNRKIFTLNGEFTNCTSNSNLKTALDKKADGTVDNLCSERLAWLRGYTAITGASWDSISKIVTFTAPNHGLKAGDSVVVTGVTPSAYNKTYTIASAAKDTFTTTLDTDPGTYIPDETDSSSSNDDRVRYKDFRDRSSVLGDIMNSGTVYAQKEDFGYGGDNIAVTGGSTSYKDYVVTKASRTPVVYVGANDGMLHAFNAKGCAPDPTTCSDAGKELFAYVPAGVYGNLSALTDPAYGKSHKYFVDGTPTLGDAYIGGWKTYLVGGLRAGGKSIYALDISNPDNFAADNVKWEYTDTDLGLTFGQPQIAAVSATQWAAIFGNGYNSSSEKAYLYIVDLSDGSLIAKIATNNDTSNGLSTPYPFDKEGDGIVDVIYAGDLQGNLWKFEKNSSGTWVLGNGGVSLFTARNASNQVQAITTQPKAAIIDGKVMVYFGTGRYLEATDLTNDNMQSFYGIWDKSENVTVSRINLVQQTISPQEVTAGSFTARTVSNNTTTDSSKRGCYLNFPATTGQPSERIASPILIKSFNSSSLKTRVVFTTSTPTANLCAIGGTSWLMELSTNCGRLEGKSPFDINGDQKFDDNDLGTIDGQSGQTFSGLKLKPETGIVNEITWVEGDPLKGIAYKLLPGTSSGKIESIRNSSDLVIGPPKRTSWEQIQ